MVLLKPNERSDLRQVEIAGVDTKFVEDRKGLFLELLEVIRVLESSNEQPETVRTFEQRFGLRQKAPLIRFRFLDESLLVQGLSDLAVPSSDFARLTPN